MLLVSNNVNIDPGCKIAENVFIGHNTVIRENVTIGKGSVIGHNVVIEKDTVIGENTTIQSQCHITAYAKIGNNVFFGPMAMCINTWNIAKHRNFDAVSIGPTIEDNVRIGAGAVIMPNVHIGKECVIGANSTVCKDCEAYGKYIGSPAEWKGMVPQDEYIEEG